ncbi:phage anti-repressor protein [Bartonella japonica]|uniref:Phage anti-repressor protein n=1 Tax=Bartonella japonica TaxID=357761 RepID=A0ABV2FQ00_9HYPH
MNTLIEIKEQIIDQETFQTVNARDLHTFLAIRKRFATWITNRIDQYAFEEGKDYILTLPKRLG